MIGHYSQLAHQGISDPSRSMANGGGSGGGGSSNPDTRYANLDQLYGTQNQASQFMLNNAMPHVPALTQNSIDMNNDAMDGTLASQMRQQAGNEAQATFGAALGANDRNMQRYGMGMNANRIMSENNRNAIMGAASKTGAMNRAAASAEDMKWNRNAATFGQVMGMNNGALQGMSSAASGMAGVANNMANNDQKNAAGYGQAGAAFGAALMKADGGYIEGEKPVRLASGGDAWAEYKAANPVKPMGSSGGGKRTNPYMAMLSGAAPSLAGGAVKDLFKGSKGSIYKGVKSAYDSVKGLSSAKDVQSLNDSQEAIRAAQEAENVAKAAQELEQIQSTASAASDAYSAGSAAADGYAALEGSQSLISAAPAATDAVATAVPAAAVVTEIPLAANGGYIKDGCVKKANAYAMGGLANTSVAKSNQIDNSSGLAQMDASGNMSVAKMGTSPTSSSGTKMETHAKPVVDTMYSGKTDGMGESSDGDPDGFGVHSGDNRHMAGKATMQVIGNWLGPVGGGAIGGALAEVLHPVGEAVSRNVIRAGDKLGGASGALMLDPIGTTVSGKYSNEELAKGHLGVALGTATGMPWLGKFLADGGRVDHTDGGDVQGPGTETSDDIPAWLSDGEIVENAEAVDLPEAHTKAVIAQWDKSGGSTKDLLLAINDAGLEKRKNQFACGGAVKHGIKLAGGGFLGGNLGIAMGAGVDQWNKQQSIDQHQQQIDLMKNRDARDAERDGRETKKFDWETTDRAQKDLERSTMIGIGKEAANMTDVNAHTANAQEVAQASAKQAGVDYQPLTSEQKGVIQAGFTPDKAGAAKMQATKLRQIGRVSEADAAERAFEGETFKDGWNRLVEKGASYKEKMDYFAKLNPEKAMHFETLNSVAEAKTEAALNRQAQIAQAAIDRQSSAHAQQMRMLEARLEGKGTSGSGETAQSPVALDKKKFQDLNKIDDTDQSNAAYGHYLNLVREMGPQAATLSANNEAQRMAVLIASGKVQPVADFNPNTLGFSYGVKNERGDLYPLKRNYDPLSNDTRTGRPLFGEKDILAKQVAGLESMKVQRPAEFVQAQELAKDPVKMANFGKHYESQGRNLPDDQLRVYNAAQIINKLPKPAAPDAAKKVEVQKQNSRDLLDVIPRVNQNVKEGHVPGAVDYLKEWFNPTIGVKK